ncbi:MAG TPA: SAM-dependent methyltransferase [Dehalococcoidia bacterium]|nr:SAM-dependent methyltransferase [Dehalococcoidia bacterium]
MQIDIRSTDRLRGKTPVELGPILASLATAARDSSQDLTKLRVVLDWVQYRQSFRPIVDVRTILPSALAGEAGPSYELAIDLRRAGNADLDSLIPAALARAAAGEDGRRQYLENWQPGTTSCIWEFNGLYWNALGLWEKATGREYEQALPGGESDARNSEMAREIILELFKVWDALAERHALPEDLHVLELGVGNGNQARVWLDEFLRLDREMHKDYYRRLHYLMADYSQHVLDRARETVGPHADRCSSLAFDARMPTKTLGFLRGKTFLIYISNVYDNLPTDEVVRIGGHLYQVEVRAYLAAAQAVKIAEELGIEPDALPELTYRLLQLGPDLLSRAAPERFPEGAMQAVNFWKNVWEAVRLEERYVPIEGLDSYRVAAGIGGEVLRPIIEANGDVRMHISNGAAASFVDSLPLLHPFGILQCLDIFTTDISQYQTFRGPGKYDGSVVNWCNGPLLAAVGRRKGYDVNFSTFQRSGSNIQTLTARIQE